MVKILVLEPDGDLNGIICECLTEAGYEPVPCEPSRAVALAAELPAGAVVAALSSIAMEQAPLFMALRSDPRTINIPLIIITGRGPTTLRRRLGEKPPLVLFKPFDLVSLVQTVEQALGG